MFYVFFSVIWINQAVILGPSIYSVLRNLAKNSYITEFDFTFCSDFFYVDSILYTIVYGVQRDLFLVKNNMLCVDTDTMFS